MFCVGSKKLEEYETMVLTDDECYGKREEVSKRIV